MVLKSTDFTKIAEGVDCYLDLVFPDFKAHIDAEHVSGQLYATAGEFAGQVNQIDAGELHRVYMNQVTVAS